MQKRTIILALVVLMAIFIGVTIAVQQTNHPLLKRVVAQQAEILDTQKQILKTLQAGSSGSQKAGGDLQGVGKKLGSLETKIDRIVAVFDKIRPPQGAGGPAGRPQRPQEDYNTVHEIPVDHSYVYGDKNAPITITAFGDFQCPFCARFQPIAKQFVKENPGKVNFMMKYFPLGFHKEAKNAARAAMAAGEQGKFWEMYDMLLKDFRNLNEDKYMALAKELKLNMKKFKRAYEDKDGKFEKLITADLQLGAKVGVRGTPTFYINGKKTRARDAAGYKAEIDKILSGKGK